MNKQKFHNIVFGLICISIAWSITATFLGLILFLVGSYSLHEVIVQMGSFLVLGYVTLLVNSIIAFTPKLVKYLRSKFKHRNDDV